MRVPFVQLDPLADLPLICYTVLFEAQTCLQERLANES